MKPASLFLREWRRELGLTQLSAAMSLGVCLRTYRGYELGQPCKKSITIAATAIAAIEKQEAKDLKELKEKQFIKNARYRAKQKAKKEKQ